MVYNVSRGQTEKLEAYADLLLKWNKKINLVSKKTEPLVWERHIFDSIRLKEYIGDIERVIDVGSGGGFPGVVLSVLGIRVVLVEADHRKAVFLKEVVRALELEAEVLPIRVEKLQTTTDVIVARGFAELNTILQLTNDITCDRYLLLKGKKTAEEIERAKACWAFDYKIYGDQNDSCVLEVKKKSHGD